MERALWGVFSFWERIEFAIRKRVKGLEEDGELLNVNREERRVDRKVASRIMGEK
jgi:hypothetical protein